MSLPIVAIIGRTNVGKSTLFNRIIRRRDAIVDDMPGVTRDRKFSEAEWAGHHFVLVDTGGYLPDADNQINREVFQQVQDAIQESDLVVFLVDAKTGLTALDEEISTLLQKSGGKVILTINKVDRDSSELDVSEFYKLGLGEPVSIAASNGRKIGDFLDEVVANLPERKKHLDGEAENRISLAIVGRPNVGKSSLVNALLGEEKQIVTEIPGTTRDSIDTLFKHQGQEFLLIDTAGLRKKTKITDSIEFYSTLRSLNSIRRCDVTIVMVDAMLGLEMQDKKILQEAIRLNKGVMLAVNKWDLIEKETNTAKEFEDEIKDRLKSVDYLPVMFISALTKQRIFKLIEVAKSVYTERKKTIQTVALNKFLEKLIERYPPPSMDRREVKIKYCTQVKSNPPVIAFFTNAPKSIRPNYRSYIENQLRKQFGFLGVPLSLVFRQKSK